MHFISDELENYIVEHSEDETGLLRELTRLHNYSLFILNF